MSFLGLRAAAKSDLRRSRRPPWAHMAPRSSQEGAFSIHYLRFPACFFEALPFPWVVLLRVRVRLSSMFWGLRRFNFASVKPSMPESLGGRRGSRSDMNKVVYYANTSEPSGDRARQRLQEGVWDSDGPKIFGAKISYVLVWESDGTTVGGFWPSEDCAKTVGGGVSSFFNVVFMPSGGGSSPTQRPISALTVLQTIAI